ncbi:hypothetical protein PHYBOEH_008770 [Phytophthora boehmeriae]|uniref:Glycoside hydrolase family 5 C-terminal domain-containing protein n=1 Tax=Phytophthora boehmeriae TaxID=109152 RepID=A0A8T1VZ14_9STRA|nr:hypothetical protein PHYBOEH_008770 [Phytophthora boehmeriae]
MNKCLLKNTYKYTTKSGEEVVLNLTNANVARPHVCAVAGATLRSELTSCTSVFTFEYLSRPPKSSDTHPTEIFVPHVHYPTGYRVTASDGHCIVEKHEGYDIIRHQPDKHDHKHELVVERITMKKQPKTPAVGLHGHSNMPVYVALGMAVVAPFMA